MFIKNPLLFYVILMKNNKGFLIEQLRRLYRVVLIFHEAYTFKLINRFNCQ